MKYLNKLFAFDDRPSSNNQSSASLTSSLYSVIFVSKPVQSYKEREKSAIEAEFDNSNNQVTLVTHSEANLWEARRRVEEEEDEEEGEGGGEPASQLELLERAESCGLGGYLLTAEIGKTIASTSAITSIDASNQLIEDDWILIDEQTPPSATTYINNSCERHRLKRISSSSSGNSAFGGAINRTCNKWPPTLELIRQQTMALDKTDIELIKASWKPVRKDPLAHGVLLFKGLFTKFPQYLGFFPQFSGLDLERIDENRRLQRHAVKVIETVTFVVDYIGDESKTTQLNEALIGLVKSHLKRKIGSAEFRNLGIVLIDFICDVNHRRNSGSTQKLDGQQHSHLNKSSTSDSSNSSSTESETMTSALDKIRTSSSPSASSDEESYLVGGVTGNTGSGSDINLNENLIKSLNVSDNTQRSTMKKKTADLDVEQERKTDQPIAKIDTNLLVAAWTKLYGGILDLVGREEGQGSPE